jgi:hypothetical protein
MGAQAVLIFPEDPGGGGFAGFVGVGSGGVGGIDHFDEVGHVDLAVVEGDEHPPERFVEARPLHAVDRGQGRPGRLGGVGVPQLDVGGAGPALHPSRPAVRPGQLVAEGVRRLPDPRPHL